MAKIIVLDTSFLLELFKVPLDHVQEKHEMAVALFEDAIKKSYDIYCPLGVLYELANHIVDIQNHAAQRVIAENFKTMVLSAWTKNTPFTIVPSGNSEHAFIELSSLPTLCQRYQENIRQGLGLTDCSIIDVAMTIKKGYEQRDKKWPAHIWSCHRALKAMEPDTFAHQYY